MRQPDTASMRLLGLYVAALTAGWVMLFAYAVHAVMPTNPIHLPFEDSLRVVQWFPQGWRFYTRDPREAYLLVYDLLNDDLSPLAWPNSHPKNYFGLKRLGRSQGIELGLIDVQVPERSWRPCEAAPLDCLRLAPVTVNAVNPSPNPSLCGEIGIVRIRPVPWAWSRSRELLDMPSRVVRVKVTCSSD